jgi:hypothetical protein
MWSRNLKTWCHMPYFGCSATRITMFGEEYISQNYSLCVFLTSIYFLILRPEHHQRHVLQHPQLRSTLNMKDQVSHPYKTTGVIIIHHHHHLLLPPWIRSFDLFWYRRAAIYSWGGHDLFSLKVCSWGRVSEVWCCLWQRKMGNHEARYDLPRCCRDALSKKW